MRWFLIALAALLFLPSEAMAWGNPGHATVCHIAYLRLTPTARRKVDLLLHAGPFGQSGTARRTVPYPTFAQACTFPDNPHERGDEHFVNYDRSLRAIRADTLCGRGVLCLYSAIEEELAVLTSKDVSDLGRAAALFYVGHWIGDLHQPLHISFGDDHGGGSVKTTGVCGADGLHSVWDKCLVENLFQNLGADAPRLPHTTPTNQWDNARAAAQYLNGQITQEMASQWLASREAWQWQARAMRSRCSRRFNIASIIAAGRAAGIARRRVYLGQAFRLAPSTLPTPTSPTSEMMSGLGFSRPASGSRVSSTRRWIGSVPEAGDGIKRLKIKFVRRRGLATNHSLETRRASNTSDVIVPVTGRPLLV